MINKNKLLKTIIKLSHDIAIADLRLQNMEAEKIKLTYNDMLYIDIIQARPGKYTATKIADMLQVSRPYVTQKINNLEKRGYISKVQDKNDKRIYYLSVQEHAFPEGYKQSFDEIDDVILDKLTEQYTEEEINQFLNMMNLMGDVIAEESYKYKK